MVFFNFKLLLLLVEVRRQIHTSTRSELRHDSNRPSRIARSNYNSGYQETEHSRGRGGIPSLLQSVARSGNREGTYDFRL